MKLLLNNIVKSPEREKLEELYKTNKELAGIVFRNQPKSASTTEVVIIDWEDGAITMRAQNGFLCISRTNKAYYKRTINSEIVLRNNKIWLKMPKSVKPANWSIIFNDEFKKFLMDKFLWMRFVSENSVLHSLPFNSIVHHKLYSYTDCIKFMFKCSLPTAKMLVEQSIHYTEWRRWLLTNTLTNIDNFNIDFFHHNHREIFLDAVKMADILRKKINCAWSVNRLKQEHDTWSKEMTEIVAAASNRPLRVAPEFRKVTEVYPDAVLIEDTKSLALEGQSQRHCVASYSNNVDSGRCAIFHVKGYTLELGVNGGNYIIRQFKGLKNAEAPQALRDEVAKALSAIELPAETNDMLENLPF